MSLTYIGEQITIYFGSVILIIGLIGNGINILVFFGNRQTPSAFYYIIASLFNALYILINLLSRIISVGSGFDLSSVSAVWCKLRQFCIFTLSLVTFACSCLSTIDLYFCTSHNINLRRLSTIKRTYITTSIILLLSLFHGIFTIIFVAPSSTRKICSSTTFGYSTYVRVFVIGVIGFIPISIMSIFGYLIYRNLHRTLALVEQRADHQMVQMVFIQISLCIIGIFPFSSNNLYSYITVNNIKSTDQITIENFVTTITSLISYIYYAGSCYIFLITSKKFRRTLKNRLQLCFSRYPIVPVDHTH